MRLPAPTTGASGKAAPVASAKLFKDMRLTASSPMILTTKPQGRVMAGKGHMAGNLTPISLLHTLSRALQMSTDDTCTKSVQYVGSSRPTSCLILDGDLQKQVHPHAPQMLKLTPGSNANHANNPAIGTHQHASRLHSHITLLRIKWMSELSVTEARHSGLWSLQQPNMQSGLT